IRDLIVTGVQTCALPISSASVTLGSGGGSPPRFHIRAPSQPSGTARGSTIHSRGRIQRAAQAEASSARLRATVVLISKTTEVTRSEERRVGKERRCGWRA